MKPVFFATADEFRAWLDANHDRETELLVGFYKVRSGIPSITWAEAVDEALCYGWIDGVRTRLDDERYTIRFTPRKPGSTWSDRNMKRVAELQNASRMQPAGLRAFEQRTESNSRIYSFEQDRESIAFDPDYRARFEADHQAWAFFREQAPWYQRAATWWVMSAKREPTRERRLSQLIQDSARAKRIRQLDRGASANA